MRDNICITRTPDKFTMIVILGNSRILLYKNDHNKTLGNSRILLYKNDHNKI